MTAAGFLLAFVVFVLVTSLAFAVSVDEPIPTLGLSGVVWGYMGMFLFRYPKDDIDCGIWILWKLKTFEVPAFLFILAFLAFDIVGYRSGDDPSINYVAHFSGFVAGALYKLAFWNTFSTEVPQPKKRPLLGPATRGWRR
jgi:membrane associated rhomboid family serine protease